MTTQEVAPLPAPALPNPPFAGPLSRVRSYQYLVVVNQDTPGINALIANSPADLVVLGFGVYNGSGALNRAAANPTGDKIILSYVDLGEAMSYAEPQFFTGGQLPSWFGAANPDFPDLYTVQYWNPAWKVAILEIIDKIIAKGFDGAMLDVCNAHTYWAPGNRFGNPVYADGLSAMATLITDIRNHIKATYPGRTFYLMCGHAVDVAREFPQAAKNLDIAFNEVVYYGLGGTISGYRGTGLTRFLRVEAVPPYLAANVFVFGGDYPPLTDSAAVLKSLAFYSNLGWIPTVNNESQTQAVLSTGPFMFMATATNPTVTGKAGFRNYLSGGVAPNTTLSGANQDDFFIGGPGQNTINGGDGNDTIYAHPEYSALKGKLVVSLSFTSSGTATTPSAAISVNGHAAIAATPITSRYGTSTQVFEIDASALQSISSVVITVSNASSVNQNNYSNVAIDNVLWNGVAVSLPAASYSSGASTTSGFTFSNNGTVTFSAASFVVTSPFLPITSDTIDGGGGTNTVVYRGASEGYTLAKQSNGSWTVTSSRTAEGPDTLVNIQSVVFSDKTESLN